MRGGGQFLLPITQEEKDKGDAVLEEMGIGKNDWFVCIYARDAAYFSNEKVAKIYQKMSKNQYLCMADVYAQSIRDSDIDTLELAVKYILDKGGFVIRLGYLVAKEFKFKHPRVIDYPYTKWRSDFMDIYLQYRTKFVLSSSGGGATDVVMLFHTPYCSVNMEGYFRVFYENSISIPRKFTYKGELVSLRDFIALANSYYGNDDPGVRCNYTMFYDKHHLVSIFNTPEEILEITKEMFERLEGTFTQTQEDIELQKEADSIYATFKGEGDIPTKHFANVGKQFLRDNASWYLAQPKINWQSG